jgi:2-polyprenyl-3-methyl-5-hydroxy-6-metoxy-1,4-benzoquinol methylase
MDDAATIPGRNPKAADRLIMPRPRNTPTTIEGATDSTDATASPLGAAMAVQARLRADRADGKALVMTHRLPRVRVVDRDAFLLDAAAGRVVTHVGFADAGMRDVACRDGHWLHARLAAVARSLVGVDVDAAGVAEAKEAGYEAHVIDCRDPDDIARAAVRPAELLVAGEVIEHVDSVGAFLDGLRALTTPDGTMIVTTPNAFRLLNVAATLTGRELVHPDHVSWYSWYTLINVLERHSWRVVAFHPYQAPAHEVRGGTRFVLAAERAAARLFAPFLANGLIAVCRQIPSAA